MGTWGTAIKSNDTSSDVYDEFYELYNEGEDPNSIAQKLIKENDELVNDPENSNNFWFALALALWETSALTEDIYSKVKKRIESGQDLKVWRELGADENDIKNRKNVLENFLKKISSQKAKTKVRKKKKNKEPVFEKGTCLSFKLKNGNFGGAIVLEAERLTGLGYNLIVTTRINKPSEPTINDFQEADVLVLDYASWNSRTAIGWYLAVSFTEEFSEIFDIVGKIKVDKSFSPDDHELGALYAGGWENIIEPVDQQIEYEGSGGVSKSFPVSRLYKKKKWWDFS